MPSVPPAPGAVVDDELLAVGLRQLLREDARHQVRGASGRERRDDAHGPGRVVLRGGGQGGQAQRGDCGEFEAAIQREAVHGVIGPVQIGSKGRILH